MVTRRHASPRRRLGVLALALLAVSAACRERPPADRPTGAAVSRDTLLVLDRETTVRVRTAGAGADTLVFLPTSPLDAEYAIASMGPIAQRHTVIFVDLPGRGGARAPAEASPTVRGDADALASALQHLGLSRVTLAADGTAVATAIWYAALHPGAVRRMVWFTPVGPIFESVRGLALTVSDTAVARRFDAAMIAREHMTEPDTFCRRFWGYYLSPMVVADSVTVRRLAPAVCEASRAVPLDALNRNARHLVPLIRTDLRPLASGLSLPVLLVQGDAHPAYRFLASEWRAALPAVRVVEVPGWPQFPWLQAPAATADAVREFLATPVPPANP